MTSVLRWSIGGEGLDKGTRVTGSFQPRLLRAGARRRSVRRWYTMIYGYILVYEKAWVWFWHLDGWNATTAFHRCAEGAVLQEIFSNIRNRNSFQQSDFFRSRSPSRVLGDAGQSWRICRFHGAI